MRTWTIRGLLLISLLLWAVTAVSAAPAPPPDSQPGSAGGPAGLDCQSPTCAEEKESGLNDKQTFRTATLYLRLGLWEPAADILAALVDETSDLNGLITLQSRIVAVLEALGEHTNAVDLAQKTVALIDGKADLPSLRLMLDMTLIRSGRRGGRPEVERRAMTDASAVAARLDTPLGHLARFMIDSYTFETEWKRKPDLDPQAFMARHDAAWKTFRALSPEVRLAPFVMTWTGDAARIWMVAAVRLALQQKEGPVQDAVVQRFLDDLQFLAGLLEKRMDPELVVTCAEAAIDCAQVARESREYEHARTILGSGQEILDAYEGPLLQGLLKAGVDGSQSAASRTRARLLHEKALLLMAIDPRRNVVEATTLLSQAADLASKGGDAIRTVEIDNDWSQALVKGRPADWQPQATRRADEALALARRLQYRPGLIAALGNRGELLAVGGDRPAAIKALQEAVDAIEQYINELGPASADGVRKGWSHIYDLLARLQLESGQGREAFSTLGRGQEVKVGAPIDVSRVATRDPQLAASLQRAGQARERTRALQQELTEQTARGGNPQSVARLTQMLASSKQQFFAELGNIRARDPDYERLLAVRPVNFAAVQDAIPNDTVLVQIFPSAEKLYLFVVTTKTFKIVSVNAKREEIERLVDEFRHEVASYRPHRGGGRFDFGSAEAKALRDCVTTLHALLVDPIEADLADKDVVAFIPTGTLFYLPLQAVARMHEGRLQFLVERKQVAVLAKASDIAQIREKPAAAKGELVAFGNPDGSLAGSQQEVQALASLFPGAHVYVGPQATTQRLQGLQGHVAYLHLATHGILDARDPNASYMVMAGSDASARLHVSDIFGLPLQGTRIVTLSACQTALGASNPGSELSSLAEAFSIAGSPTVVASLWRVSDRSTRDLMVAFYQQLSKGSSRARALQQAQLQLLRSDEWRHPFYWAPFVILGDWR